MNDTVSKIVTKAYEVVYPDSLTLKKGESVTILRKESDPRWLGWCWCETSNGKCIWISENDLNIEGDRGTLLTNYNSCELSVFIGESIKILKKDNGWLWVENSDGKQGWIPDEVIK